MYNFNEWENLRGKSGYVVIRHFLFGKKEYDCDELNIINDETKIGVIVKGCSLFIYKEDIEGFYIEGNTYRVNDSDLEIRVII